MAGPTARSRVPNGTKGLITQRDVLLARGRLVNSLGWLTNDPVINTVFPGAAGMPEPFPPIADLAAVTIATGPSCKLVVLATRSITLSVTDSQSSLTVFTQSNHQENRQRTSI
ncbi:hypothetical protein CHARACLAT_031244 [Characodon lateralis]|uniref:Uncharacterized protein n=1 Tax=Characodon lateralis TaxID=208331 RepID=A0ABU7EEE6_9TELE|nr:hypothetical protein [Characodon lateralis]